LKLSNELHSPSGIGAEGTPCLTHLPSAQIHVSSGPLIKNQVNKTKMPIIIVIKIFLLLVICPKSYHNCVELSNKVLPQRDDVRTRIEKVAIEIFGWWRRESEVFSIPQLSL